jgi:hypothetical protein
MAPAQNGAAPEGIELLRAALHDRPIGATIRTT